MTVMSIALGLAIVLWMQCILAGRNHNMIERITSTYTGHIQIMRADFQTDRLTTQAFDHDFTDLVRDLPAEAKVTSRVHLPALVASSEQSIPVLLEGIDPKHEPQITRVKENLVEGEFLEPEEDPDCPSRQVYLGRALAQLLGVEVGSKVVFLAQDANGSLGNDLFRVKGLYDSKAPEFDKSYAFAPLACVKKIGAITGLHEMVIGLPSSGPEVGIAARLQARMPEGMKVTTWKESIPSVASMVKFNDATLVMVSTMLFSVIIIGVINTLLMNVFERTREFGVMLALGTTPGQLRLMIIAESLVMGVLSAAVGIVLGSLAVLYHQRTGFDLGPFFGERTGTDQITFDLVIHPIFMWGPFLKSVLITIGFVVVAGFYPAFRASRLNPVETMRS